MENEVITLIRQKLPELIRTAPEIREWILDLTREHFAERVQTDARFEQMLTEFRRDREEWLRRWDRRDAEWEARWQRREEEWEARWQRREEEWEARWHQQQERWEQRWHQQQEQWEARWQQQLAAWRAEWQQQREEWEARWHQQQEQWEQRWQENQRLICTLIQRIDTGISAIGARWGIFAESAFRNGIQAILEESFGVRVFRYQGYDEEGMVFGHPDQVELDIIIQNNTLIVCEIKSSMSRGDMYTFDRKVRFYEQRENRRPHRKIIISPMVEEKAVQIAQNLGIEVYTHADEVSLATPAGGEQKNKTVPEP